MQTIELPDVTMTEESRDGNFEYADIDIQARQDKTMEDEKIIDLYWDRNQSAIVETDKKYGNYCRKIADNILYNKEDSEECVNDTWLRAWNSMPEERPSILSAFLGAITRNLSLDRYRRRHAAKRGSGEVSYIFDEMWDCAGGENPVEQVEQKELVECIDRFLAELDNESRVLFVRRYWYMDSIAEIAGRFGYSESRVKSNMFRTRNKLRNRLVQEHFI